MLSELLKIQKFGHLLIGILCMFFYSIFCTFLQFLVLGFGLVHYGSETFNYVILLYNSYRKYYGHKIAIYRKIKIT